MSYKYILVIERACLTVFCDKYFKRLSWIEKGLKHSLETRWKLSSVGKKGLIDRMGFLSKAFTAEFVCLLFCNSKE